jgi:hypothetical protein
MGAGDNADALKKFEQAYACRPDAHTLQLAFMAACNVPDLVRARHWWRRLSSDEQDRDVMMCIRRGITRGRLDGTDLGVRNAPAALDRDMISNAIAAMHPQLVACGKKFPSVHGKVKIHAQVAPAGDVTAASVEESPDPGLATCVQEAISIASFPVTLEGGSFGYPFVFPM